jgi:hypothetical protein
MKEVLSEFNLGEARRLILNKLKTANQDTP